MIQKKKKEPDEREKRPKKFKRKSKLTSKKKDSKKIKQKFQIFSSQKLQKRADIFKVDKIISYNSYVTYDMW